MKKIILLNILFLNLIYSQQTPAPDQDKSVLIFGFAIFFNYAASIFSITLPNKEF